MVCSIGLEQLSRGSILCKPMKKALIAAGALLAAAIAAIAVFRGGSGDVPKKLYVALEGDGAVAVVDLKHRTVLKRIDLSETKNGETARYAPSAVSTAPDGKTVWVVANARRESGSATRLDPDKVIVIDAATDSIVRRISTIAGAELAGIGFAEGSMTAYATARKENVIYRMRVSDFSVLKKLGLPAGSGPRGIRIAPDGETAYVALSQGKGVAIVDLIADTAVIGGLKGSAAGAGVTPDGRFSFVSLADAKSIAFFSIEKKSVKYVDLPQGARGPAGVYPTPDSRFVYVADRGGDSDGTAGNTVYKVETSSGKVVAAIAVGGAPRDLVVSGDGGFVYVTNASSGDVSVVDSRSDREIARIPVGKGPGGIDVWPKVRSEGL